MSRITDKISKLLAKAQGTTFDAEADAFLQKALDLLNEHGLTMADVAQADHEDPVALERGAAKFWASASYRLKMYAQLAVYYGCRPVYQRKGNQFIIDIVGRESSRTTFHLMLPFIDKQVNAAARELVNDGTFTTMSKATRAVGNALTLRLARLIQEQKEKDEAVRQQRGFGLVPVDQIEAVLKAEFPNMRKAQQRKASTTLSAMEKAKGIAIHRQTAGKTQLRLG